MTQQETVADVELRSVLTRMSERANTCESLREAQFLAVCAGQIESALDHLSASRASVGEDYARGLQVASDLCQSRAEWVTAGELHRMSLAALATPPPQPKDAEVAAWMATHGKYAEAFKSYETLMTFIASDEANSVLGDGEEWTIKPLYAHPAPPASQAVGDKDGERVAELEKLLSSIRKLCSRPGDAKRPENCTSAMAELTGIPRGGECLSHQSLRRFIREHIDAAMLNGERGKV